MHPTIPRAVFVLILLLMTAAACTNERPAVSSTSSAAATPAAVDDGVKPPREIALEIEASKSGLRSETRNDESGGMNHSEARYYVGSTLVLVEERMGVPGQRPSESAYYFDDDRLVFFRGRGTRTIFVPGSEGTREQYEIELGFDLDGNVVDSVKIINGEPAPLEPFDFETPKARARILTGEPPVQ